MRVAVAIVGFRNTDDIIRCLSGLERSTHGDFEVLICENGGPAAYAALEAALPPHLSGGQPVRAVLAPGNLGYAGGVNVCLAQTPTADAWWILNPDTYPEPEAMAALVERLSAGDCQAVGGALYFPDGKVQSDGGLWRAWLARPESIGYGRALDSPVDVASVERRLSYLSGASMMVSRVFVDAVGLMREDYFLYCEEVEWCLRSRRRGMRLGFARDARVLHFQGTTTGSVEDIAKRPRMPVYLDTRNKLLVTRDCFPLLLPVAAVAVPALVCLRLASKGAWRQCLYVVAGCWAGILNRRGAPTWLEP